MSLKTVNGDIFNSEAIILCHQVNCRGVMGAGLAKQIRSRYSPAYQQYLALCRKHKDNPKELLGTAQGVWCDEPIENRKGRFKYGGQRFVVNLFAQDRYGRDGLYTDYEAFEKCLEKLAYQLSGIGRRIAMPYGIGCGLAGGDWNVIYDIIEQSSLAEAHRVELWKKG